MYFGTLRWRVPILFRGDGMRCLSPMIRSWEGCIGMEAQGQLAADYTILVR